MVLTSEDLIFSDASRAPLHGRHVTQRHLAPLLRKTGLPAIRFHAGIPAQHRVKALGRLAMHRGLAMRMAVQGDAHILVTEHLGDELGARTRGELANSGLPAVAPER